MADFTYTLRSDASGHPAYTTWHGIRNDFAANNRMGAGTGVIGSGVLYIKVRGSNTGAGNANFVTAVGITVSSGGSMVIEADTNPWNASSATAAGYSTSFDSCTFANDEGLFCNFPCNITVRNLMFSFNLSANAGLWIVQPSASLTTLWENLVLEQTQNAASWAASAESGVTMRNCVFLSRSTNSGAAALSCNIRHSVSPTIEQCTLVTNSASTNAITDSGATGAQPTLKNSYVGGASTPFGGLTYNAASVGNATSAASGAPGSGAIYNVAVSTTNFENVTSAGDWRSKAASVLTTTGCTELGSTPTDAYGRARETTTTIGMFKAEVGGTAGAPRLTGKQMTGGFFDLTGGTN